MSNFCIEHQKTCEFANNYGYCTITACKYWEYKYEPDGTVTRKYIEDPLADVELLLKMYGNQEIKSDAGKPKLTLVPRQIIFDIAKIREYGVNKYGSSENWRAVDIQRYRDAAFRHFMKYLDDPKGVDEESGLTHLAHLACNVAFLCELEKVTE